ncbi:hypothetical protein HMPREF1989_00477 [Porphyromonas gingivalis F0566]|nr:hypothetical protein HMPREF1989_00477 [Porphyromonas gingivalis F0566]
MNFIVCFEAWFFRIFVHSFRTILFRVLFSPRTTKVMRKEVVQTLCLSLSLRVFGKYIK